MRKLILALCLSGSNLLAQTLPLPPPMSFGLFGDTPYSQWEREQLPAMLEAMGHEGLAFAVHDGDIKNGSSVCSDQVFLDVLGVFRAAPLPLVYVPGDNEWTDCHRSNNGRYDSAERLRKLRELFFQGDHALGQGRLKLTRQSEDSRYSEYRENVRWEMGGVLFVGLNLPGSDNNYHGASRGSGPVAEFFARGAANHAWLAQSFALARHKKLAGVLLVIQGNPEFEAASAGQIKPGYRHFIEQLRAETQAFAGQVVLVHGDSHLQKIDQPLLDERAQALVANFTRVETFGYPFMGWIKGVVDLKDPKVFRFEPRRWHSASTSTSPVLSSSPVPGR
ncbi:MAG: hypothetical protein RLZZ596_1742 [Pseudomonadota bacterium]|jgi:hypothetical protein